MNQLEAISGRHSIRQFRQQVLSTELVERVRQFCAQCRRLYPQIPLEIHLVDGSVLQPVLPGLVGGYGKILAPHYLLAASGRQPDYLENVGYTLEQVVLQLTCWGVGSCWIGGRVKQQDVAAFLPLPAEQSPVALIAFGLPADGVPLLRDPLQAKRKPLTELVIGKPDEQWSTLLAAARLAPSAINLQPWRVVLAGEKAHLFAAAGGVGQLLWRFPRLDAGIALAHIEIAADELGRAVRISRQPGVVHRRWEYVASVVRQ